MDYHKGKRPDIDWDNVTEPEVRKPDEEEFNKDLNKLLMKYGFDRVYDAVRGEHYLRKNYKYLALKMSLKEILK